jgi:hypothetical protein
MADMGIRSWWKKQREMDEEVARRRDEGTEYSSAEEQAISSSGRMGLAADERVARRAGEAGMKDVDRLSE